MMRMPLSAPMANAVRIDSVTRLGPSPTTVTVPPSFSSPAGRKIEDIRVETQKFQFLYPEGDSFHFMNTEDYNQITLQKDILDAPDLLKEGEIVTIIINTEDNLPLSVDMPMSVVLEVTHTEQGVKGNTATNATKPATVETGAVINVPLFINEGDKIKVDTAKGAYLERVKE
ncbi:MAG: elongation factor P [Lutibacter sp.]